jgi:RNA polymerase sigma-70 factor (ECF subfamily)
LKPQEKELIFLIFTAQLSYIEVEAITKIPLGTIKSRMASIKSKLKKQLVEGSG